ncbi:MAG: hypothetical protein KAJ42_13325 [Gemmatimonadetes bacterium]|nr:hypothetical protein [Gemmatimonadota bacterium]
MVGKLTPLLLIAAVGCGGSSDSPEAPVVRDSAGVRIVEYARLPSVGPVSVPEVPTLQLGVLQGDTVQEFGYVTSATRLSDGTIVVADAGASQLRAFSSGGSLRWISGREGDGPGEYRNIGWVREHGDSIAVFDRALRRLTILSADGEMRRVVNPELTPDGLRPSVISVLSDGSMIISAQVSLTPNIPPGINRPPISVSQYSPGGTYTHAIASISGSEWVLAAVDGGRVLAPRVFGSSGVVTAASGTVAVAETERFEIRSLDRGGALHGILRVLEDPRSVTGEDIHRYRDYLLDREPDASRHPRIQRVVDAMPFPENHPALRRIYFDRASRLWVEEYRFPWDSQSSFLVFDESGELMRRIQLPANHLLLEAGPGYMLLRATDDLGVQYVRLYEVELG